MKRILCLCLTALLCFSLCACDGITSLLDQFEIPNPIDDLLNDANAGDLPNNLLPSSSQENTLPDFPGFPNFPGITPTEATEPTEPVKPTQPPEEQKSFVMPKCTNFSLYTIAPQLESAGLKVTVRYQSSSLIPDGYIISQSISQGTQVLPGQSVTLVVSGVDTSNPYNYSQKLTVTAVPGSYRAVASLYEWENGAWHKIASYTATVGKNGIGEGKEGSRRTPQGLHKLGVILTAENVNAGDYPVYTATSDTSVVNDLDSRYYNCIMEKDDIPSGTDYDRIGKGLTNGTTYATIYIEHNGSGFSSENVVSGGGSAIGVRGQYGSLAATYGDVDISWTDMKDLISRLDPDKNPMIEIKTV